MAENSSPAPEMTDEERKADFDKRCADFRAELIPLLEKYNIGIGTNFAELLGNQIMPTFVDMKK